MADPVVGIFAKPKTGFITPAGLHEINVTPF